jgi:DNA-binding MarR family transcriptional regulator
MEPTMKQGALHRPDFYENLSQILAELAVLRGRDLRSLKLDLDHYFILEAVVTGRAHSEAEMMRRLGRNASFCSRAVDRLEERGWLKKRPKLKGVDSKFQVKITRQGTRIYQQQLLSGRHTDLQRMGRHARLTRMPTSNLNADQYGGESNGI